MGNAQEKMSNMSNVQEVKRGRGRPAAFPGQETVLGVYALPKNTIEQLEALVVARNAARKEGQPATTKNLLVNRALTAYLAKSAK